MPAFFGARRLAAYTPPPVATPWTPLALGSKLVAWWDPATGVTQSGGAVSAWKDRVSGINATQSTAAANPTYSATARNGKPGLTFDGSRYLNIPSNAVLPVGSTASAIAGAAYTSTTSTEFLIMYGDTSGNSGTANFRALGFNSGQITGAENNNDQIISQAWTENFVLWQVSAGASPTSSLTVDGGSPTTATLPNPSATPSDAGFIGTLIVGFGQWTGTIQHIIVCNDLLSASESQKLAGWESWVDGKAGSNLPAGHPYKSRAPLTSDP